MKLFKKNSPLHFTTFIFTTHQFIMAKSAPSLLFVSLVFLLGFKGRTQQLDGTLEKYASSFQPEKIYLHYDKSSYLPGETVWFKAYIQEEGVPAKSSKTLYVDWVSENGQVLHHGVSPLIDGTTNSQFEVPENYTGKFIQIKAYTKWMLNFDSSFLYTKEINILPKNSVATRGVKQVVISSLRFFPEGGEMIAGVMNKIAFKANNQWGGPVQAQGLITDSKGNKIDSFRTIHNGMGVLFLMPADGTKYFAKWKDEKGVEQTTNLPMALTSGIAMQVSGLSDKKTVTLQASGAILPNLQKVHLVGTMNQRLAFKTTVDLSTTKSARRVIPTQNFASGILTITLFDSGWQAIAERIAFINNEEYDFNTNLQVQRWGLNKRARNEIEIAIPDSISATNFSIAITDASINADSSDNIFSGLLLTQDIKGYVHNPAWYFSNKNDLTAPYLDLVMLTNGWRKFKWDAITNGILPRFAFEKDTSYLSLSGSVYGVAKNQLSGTESMVLFVRGKDSASTRTVIIPLNRNGTFEDPNFIFFDTLRVYYQLKSKLFSNAEARFMTSRLPPPNYISGSKNFINRSALLDTTGFYRHQLLSLEAQRLLALERGKMLENVTVTAKAKTPGQTLDAKYASGLFSGGDGYQFDLVNDPFSLSSLNIFNYLQGKVAGLQINSTSNPPTLSWRGGTPQLFLDEMQIDVGFISNLPVSDVAYIKVFRPPFMGAAGGGTGGAIAIYTRKGGDQANQPGKGLSTNAIMGYTNNREFYSPNYDRFDKRNEQPDMRTTLYWNPSIIVTKNKPVRIVFHNNDVTKSFRVIITGMSSDGLLTHHHEVLE